MNYLQLLRPIQWIKNLFVFAPLFFSRHLLEASLFLHALSIFLIFCLVSSSVYCLNDMVDLEADKANPQKCMRPLASGAISLLAAKCIMVICLFFASALLLFTYKWTENPQLVLPIATYLVLNIAYSLWLKNHAIVDIVCIATGFVLRVLAGGLTTGIWVSHWIIIMTFLLTLFLALAKRMSETELGNTSRKSMAGYNRPFAYAALSVMASIIIVCYILYTIDSDVILHIGTPYLYTTSIWVLAGLLRYMQLIMVFHSNEGPTTIILRDPFLIGCGVVWMLCFVVFIYML